MTIYAPHTSDYIVDDGADHTYHPHSMANVRSLFLKLKYSGGVPTVYQWDEVTQAYEFSEVLTDEMHSIPRSSVAGRPKRLEGGYERITLEIKREYLAFVDAEIQQSKANSRREYIEFLVQREMERANFVDAEIQQSKANSRREYIEFLVQREMESPS